MENNLSDWINNELLKLWKNYVDEIEDEEEDRKVPSLYPELKKNKILFVGLNPSCANRNERVAKILGKDVEVLTKEDKNAFFSWEDSLPLDDEKINNIIEERKIPRGGTNKGPYRYFTPFYRLSEKVHGNESEWTDIKVKGKRDYEDRKWEHIDVFRTIAKNQSDLKDILNMHSKGENISDFGRKQIDIFKELLEKLEPKIIIVQSALAGDIIKDELEISCEYWEEEGFQTIELDNKNIPIFFTGMLSVGYDKGSRKRLIWHVKKAKEWVERNGSSKT